MARTLMLVALSLGAACYHATPYSASSTQAKWRAMRSASSTSAGRTNPPAAGAVLTVEETYELALSNNADVAALAAAADVASAQVGAAKQIDNPQLRLTGFNVDDVLANKTQMNIGLRVPIPRPGSVRARVEGAKQLARGQESVTEDAKRLIRTRVYKLYARLAMLNEDLEQTETAMALRAERRDQIAARSELAASTKLDVAMADVLDARAKQDHALVRDQIEVVEQELARIAGITTPVRFDADPEQLGVVDRELNRDELTELAMASRPELVTTHANLEAAKSEAYIARSEAYPWFNWAQLQYRAERNAQPSAFGFGVAIVLPVLSWNRGAIKASRALVRQRQLEDNARIALVAAEVDKAAAEVERTARRVMEVERDLLPQAEAAMREAEAALASGALDPIVASDVDTQVVEARRLHLAVLLAHREALIDLESVVGAPLPSPKVDR